MKKRFVCLIFFSSIATLFPHAVFAASLVVAPSSGSYSDASSVTVTPVPTNGSESWAVWSDSSTASECDGNYNGPDTLNLQASGDGGDNCITSADEATPNFHVYFLDSVSGFNDCDGTYANCAIAGNTIASGEFILNPTNGPTGNALSTTTGLAMVLGGSLDLGSYLEHFLPYIIGIIIALLALGWAVYELRKRITGKTF